MRLPQLNPRTKKGVVSAALVFLLLCAVLASYTIQQTFFKPESPKGNLSAVQAVMPRQALWKNGVSSFLFGTNDTYEWATNNIQTQPAIQASLKSAGFTVIRSFFPDKADDATIEKRIKTIENVGAACLGVITNINNTEFNKHLVQYLGPRCQMYEFGNEPDMPGNDQIPVDKYLKQWNTVVPMLKKINPSAKFIGPVTYYNLGDHDYMRNFLLGVKVSRVLPDAVSYHSYPCWKDTQQDCSAKATKIGATVQPVRSLVQSILGKDLPIAITEWNYDPDNPPASYGDNADFITKFSNDAIQSMIKANVSIACQFDAASYAGYGKLDMFNLDTNKPKPQYDAIKSAIQTYRPQ